jgi:glutathione S-transferase
MPEQYPLGPGSALVPLDEAKLEAAVQRAVNAWAVVDTHLADGRPFMLGDELTFGDVTCGVHVNRLFQMGDEGPDGRFGHLRHLRAWYDRLCEREAYVRCVVAPTLDLSR